MTGAREPATLGAHAHVVRRGHAIARALIVCSTFAGPIRFPEASQSRVWLALRSEDLPRTLGPTPPALGPGLPVLQFCCSWAENSRYRAVLGGPPRIRIDPVEGVCGHLRTARQGVRFPPGALPVTECELPSGES